MFWEAFGHGVLFGVMILCFLAAVIFVGMCLAFLWNASRRAFATAMAIVAFLILCGVLGVLVQNVMTS